jgi:hypothetical protein
LVSKLVGQTFMFISHQSAWRFCVINIYDEKNEIVFFFFLGRKVELVQGLYLHCFKWTFWKCPFQWEATNEKVWHAFMHLHQHALAKPNFVFWRWEKGGVGFENFFLEFWYSHHVLKMFSIMFLICSPISHVFLSFFFITPYFIPHLMPKKIPL